MGQRALSLDASVPSPDAAPLALIPEVWFRCPSIMHVILLLLLLVCGAAADVRDTCLWNEVGDGIQVKAGSKCLEVNSTTEVVVHLHEDNTLSLNVTTDVRKVPAFMKWIGYRYVYQTVWIIDPDYSNYTLKHELLYKLLGAQEFVTTVFEHGHPIDKSQFIPAPKMETAFLKANTRLGTSEFLMRLEREWFFVVIDIRVDRMDKVKTSAPGEATRFEYQIKETDHMVSFTRDPVSLFDYSRYYNKPNRTLSPADVYRMIGWTPPVTQTTTKPVRLSKATKIVLILLGVALIVIVAVILIAVLMNRPRPRRNKMSRK